MRVISRRRGGPEGGSGIGKIGGCQAEGEAKSDL